MVTYAVYPVSLPAGWQVATQQERTFFAQPPPFAAIMGRDGTVAVLLSQDGGQRERPRRLLILHPDGRKAILTANAAAVLRAFHLYGAKDGYRPAPDSAPFFDSVAVSVGGKPFATFVYPFEGAYGGIDYAGFVWDAGWHGLPRGSPPFGGLGHPEPPTNVSVPAANSRSTYVIVGNFLNTFPGEDLAVAADDAHFMADVSAVVHGARITPLGEGDATAMRGNFIAGFDAQVKLVESHSPPPPAAVVWRCAAPPSPSRLVCTRTRESGHGAAFGVDSRGDAVGDDEGVLGEKGYPTLWRERKAFELSSTFGTAYAIGEDGSIVGAIGTSGFVANAREQRPTARYLDDLVPNASVHVQAALSVADDGRILALALRKDRSEELIVLKPR